MDKNYSKKGEVRISMKQYVEKIVEGFPEKIGSSTAATPAAYHLFQVRDEKEAKVLPEEQVVQFHYTVAKLLFVCMRARQDTQTAIAFLRTRIKAPDKDDWAKLKRVIKYLNGTRNLELRQIILE